MRTGKRWAGTALLLVLIASPLASVGGASSPLEGLRAETGEQRVERPSSQLVLSAEAIELGAEPIQVGDVVPVRVQVAAVEGATGSTPPARLQLLVEHGDETSIPRPVRMDVGPDRPALLVAFWEPTQAGTHQIGGIVTLGDQLVTLEPRTVHVEERSVDGEPGGKVLGSERAPEAMMWGVAAGVFSLFYVRRR